MARPTIEDIARRVGVSKGAVSFALNGRPGVSEATRARILQVAEEMNWRPHTAARALGNARAGAVGMVIARPARTLGVEPFFAQLLSGLQAGLSARSVALELLLVEDTDAEIEVYRRWASEHRVDGFVLVDLKTRDPRIGVVEALGVPAVGRSARGRDSSARVAAAPCASLKSVGSDVTSARPSRRAASRSARTRRRVCWKAGSPDTCATRVCPSAAR